MAGARSEKGAWLALGRSADWEIGDTAGWETCGTAEPSEGSGAIPSMVVYEIHGDSRRRERPEKFSRIAPLNRSVFSKWDGLEACPTLANPGRVRSVSGPFPGVSPGSTPGYCLVTLRDNEGDRCGRRAR